MSSTDTCRRHADVPKVDSNSTSVAPRQPKQLDITYDLYQAIEDLRSVPVLSWPDDVTFDDGIACDVVDQAVTTKASLSGNLIESQLGNHSTTTTTTVKVSTISSELSGVVQTDAGRPSATVDGDRGSTTSSVPLVDQPGWNVNGTHISQLSSVKGRTPTSDAGSELLSDDVFVDVATPIDADLLIDDIYEREMDELDQLDIDLIATDDTRDWPNMPTESAAVDPFDQPVPHISWDSTAIQTNRLLIESCTDSRLRHQRSSTTGRSLPPTGSAVQVHCAEVHPQSVSVNTPSSLACRSTDTSCLDASAEELFEEIVESMRDTVAEDDAELDALVDVENRLTIDATTTKSGPGGRPETAVGRGTFATVVDNNVTSPAQSLMSQPLNHHSGVNEEQDTPEEKRQKDLTVCLASTLNECLDTLSQIDSGDRMLDDVRRDTTRIERYRKYDITNSDVMNSSSSTKSSRTDSLGRQCVTSSSSGFQSDLMDVDIDEEFDVNVSLNAADNGALRSDADSTSLDSLLELNDDDGLYSDETILRRPIPPTSKRSDNHSVVSDLVEKPTIPPAQRTVQTELRVTASDRTEGVETVKHDDDVTDVENGRVMSYDETSPTVEVIAEELITQEIVLNIVLPRRSKKKEKRPETYHSSEPAENGVIDRKKNYKSPHRDFHIHRVVRCSDADDRSDNRLEISEHPKSKRLKSVTESEAAGNGSSVNEDDDQLDPSSRVTPGRSLASQYVGGPISVELERNAESLTTEEVDDDTRLRVTHRNRFKVLRAPEGSGTALFNAPVTSIHQVVDDVGRTLVGDQLHQPLPAGARVTCEAVERKSSTSLLDDDVTVVRRTIVDDSDGNRPMLTTIPEED